MSWFSYLFPQTVARFSTPYNKDVRVLKERGKYKLLANGSRQSGEYIKGLWEHAFSQFDIISSPGIRSILVLGVAGGTVIHLLRPMYPSASIIGVDIDPQMIEIGKKYFSLSSVAGLTLVTHDAKEFVSDAARRGKKWDLILTDTYVGASVPPFVGEESFLRSLKKILAPQGHLVINYLREFEYEKLSDLLFVKLRRVFPSVKDAGIHFNRFFLAGV